MNTSNKTLKDSREKTVSGRKFIVIVLLALTSTFIYFQITATDKTPNDQSVKPGCQTNPSLEVKTIRAEDQPVEVEVVKDGSDKVRGLSGRDCLNETSGMLFVYDLPGDYCYWMNDMNFAIDMIWLDDEHKVVTIKDNATPDTYPDSFCPDKPALYVLEVDSGFADRSGWRVGTQFSL